MDTLSVSGAIEIGLLGSYTISEGTFAKQGEDERYEHFRIGASQGAGIVTKSALADPIQSVARRKSDGAICVVTVFNAPACKETSKVDTSNNKEDEMRKMYLVASVLGALFAEGVSAAGAYDGVYQYGLSPAYYSVPQNGGTLLVASMAFLSVNNDVNISVGPYVVRPFWQLTASSYIRA